MASVRDSATSALANDAANSVDLASPLVQAIVDEASSRALRVTHDKAAAAQVQEKIAERLASWQARREQLVTGKLGYEAAPDVTGLLIAAEAGRWGTWTAPRSLREVEPEAVLQLQSDDRSLEVAPAWSYMALQVEEAQ